MVSQNVWSEYAENPEAGDVVLRFLAAVELSMTNLRTYLEGSNGSTVEFELIAQADGSGERILRELVIDQGHTDLTSIVSAMKLSAGERVMARVTAVTGSPSGLWLGICAGVN